MKLKEKLESAINQDDFNRFYTLCVENDIKISQDKDYTLLMFELLRCEKYTHNHSNKANSILSSVQGFAASIKKQTERTGFYEIARKFSYLCEAAEQQLTRKIVLTDLLILKMDEDKWYRKFFPDFYFMDHPDEYIAMIKAIEDAETSVSVLLAQNEEDA